jgi:tRNA threonylcarbamoyladenosine modification (KEOPS) complex Cgi121 subunit
MRVPLLQVHKLDSPLEGYHWIAVEGLRVTETLKIDKVLNQMQTIMQERKVPLQIIEAKYLAGPRHAFHAGNLAVTAHREKRARANRIEVEILLYLTGRRQIGDAIAMAGVKEDTKEIVALALGSSEDAIQTAVEELSKILHAEPDADLLEISKAKRSSLQELFGITNGELALMTRNGDWKQAMLKCVMERGAMLDALKK